MCNTKQIQRGLRKIGWAIAAVFCICGLAKPVLEVTAQEYNLTIGAGVAGGFELNWDNAGQNAKYTVEYATDLAKQQWA
jgi:hypothetical protein